MRQFWTFAVVVFTLLMMQSHASAYYSSGTGRWLTRDSLGEQDNNNMYVLVANSPPNAHDPDGRFKIWHHEKLARESAELVRQADPSVYSNISHGCWDQMLTKLVTFDSKQDVDHFENLERHYNRGIGQGFVNADRAYANYLMGESRRFEARLQGKQCDEALESLGYLVHSWQDFYAHAIRRDHRGGKENSLYNGWTAFSVGIAGNPNNRSLFWPSSFDLWIELEHPQLSEPVDFDGVEGQARARAARDFVFGELAVRLRQFFSACKCPCGRDSEFSK